MNKRNGHFLQKFFYPESVAVVGVTTKKERPNHFLVPNLINLGYTGKIYPVNPNATEMFGLKVYPSVSSIEDDVDFAVISVAYNRVLDVVKDCIAKQVKCIAITAGGFSETGVDGKRIQDEILRLVKANGIRVMGPNTLSPINSENNFAVGFGSIKRLSRGGLSMVFQSGLYQPRLNWLLSSFGLRLNKLIDLGNKMDITEVDALEYLAQDPNTKVIAIHMESIAGDAKKLIKLLRETTRKKPVIILKSGRTAAGARAASSHTGAIMKSSDTVINAVLKQTGVIRAQGLDEFFDFAKAFEYLPPLKNNRISIGVFSGGEGVITVDACQNNGLNLAEMSNETKEKLRAILPPWSEIPTNPFDHGVSFQFHDFMETWEILLNALIDDPNVDCFAAQTWAISSAIVEPLVQLFAKVAKKGKPIVTYLADPETGTEMARGFEANGIPVFPSAERAVKALAALYRYYKMRSVLTKE